MRGIRCAGRFHRGRVGVAPAARADGGHDNDRDKVQIRTVATGLDSPRHLAFGRAATCSSPRPAAAEPAPASSAGKVRHPWAHPAP